MAARLSRGIVGSGRGRLLYPTHGNELFVAFSSGVLEGLKRQGIEVRVMNTLQSGEKECRLVAGCMTEPGQVDAFLEALQGLAEA
jgi:threonine aldolase